MEENEFVIKKEGSILQVYLGFELSMANSTTLREMLSEFAPMRFAKPSRLQVLPISSVL